MLYHAILNRKDGSIVYKSQSLKRCAAVWEQKKGDMCLSWYVIYLPETQGDINETSKKKEKQ